MNKRGDVKRKEKEGWKLAFWNVARVVNKDKEFWMGLKEWDAMMLNCNDAGGWTKRDREG